MRLIDADDLIKELKQIVNTEQIFKSFTTWGNAYEDCMTMLDEAPTVDAVPVVRCKECQEMIEKGWCSLHGTPMNINDFCSYGEKRK